MEESKPSAINNVCDPTKPQYHIFAEVKPENCLAAVIYAPWVFDARQKHFYCIFGQCLNKKVNDELCSVHEFAKHKGMRIFKFLHGSASNMNPYAVTSEDMINRWVNTLTVAKLILRNSNPDATSEQEERKLSEVMTTDDGDLKSVMEQANDIIERHPKRKDADTSGRNVRLRKPRKPSGDIETTKEQMDQDFDLYDDVLELETKWAIAMNIIMRFMIDVGNHFERAVKVEELKKIEQLKYDIEMKPLNCSANVDELKDMIVNETFRLYQIDKVPNYMSKKYGAQFGEKLYKVVNFIKNISTVYKNWKCEANPPFELDKVDVGQDEL